MSFHIGQKVVCLRNGFGYPPRYRPRHGPIVGQIYTIRSIVFEDSCTGLRFVGLVMNCVNVPGVGVIEPSFSIETDGIANFRPVAEKQTDIAVFTEILNRENKNSRVPVSDHQSN